MKSTNINLTKSSLCIINFPTTPFHIHISFHFYFSSQHSSHNTWPSCLTTNTFRYFIAINEDHITDISDSTIQTIHNINLCLQLNQWHTYTITHTHNHIHYLESFIALTTFHTQTSQGARIGSLSPWLLAKLDFGSSWFPWAPLGPRILEPHINWLQEMA